jgi:hypothetical protein
LREGSTDSSATMSFQGPTGLADGLEVGSPLSAFAVRRSAEFAPEATIASLDPPYRSLVSGFRPSMAIVRLRNAGERSALGTF